MTRAPIRLGLTFLIACILGPGAGQARPASAVDSQPTLISAVVYGEDLCPVAAPDEIVVCARMPEGERYRIPGELRAQIETRGGRAWTSRVAAVEAEARKVIPGSCSPIGSGGQFGCARAALQQWALERRELQRAESLPE